jgi:NAD(P)-dependent dehydrogenase (short-subunit alcohol dehydrogenase family)
MALQKPVATTVERLAAWTSLITWNRRQADRSAECRGIRRHGTTNVTGIWLSIKHCVAPLKGARRRIIVALSSIAGCIGFPAMAPYIASKHAVYGLVKTAALELGPSNIRVNAVGPGPIDNRMIASLQDQLSPGDPAAVRGGMEASIAMRRYGTNEEVAHLLAFLASDASSYCNGSIHMIDGGYVAA